MSNLRVREPPSRPVQGSYVNEASVVIHRMRTLALSESGRSACNSSKKFCLAATSLQASSFFRSQASAKRLPAESRWPTIKTSAALAAAMKATRAFCGVRYPRQACVQTWAASRQCCLPALGQ